MSVRDDVQSIFGWWRARRAAAACQAGELRIHIFIQLYTPFIGTLMPIRGRRPHVTL